MATPSLAMIPSGYKASKVYSVLPESGVGDFDFTRATTATRINSSGLIEEMAINVPRLEYPLIDGVVNGCPSLLLEPQSTNIVTNSQVLNDAIYGTSNAVILDNNIISPDGTLNASSITDSNGGGTNVTQIYLPNLSVDVSSQYTYSIFAKKKGLNYISLRVAQFTTPVTSDCFFDLENGSIVSVATGYDSAKIENYGNGWYRCSVTFTTDATDTVGNLVVRLSEDGVGTGSVPQDGTSSVYLWGWSCEKQSYPTSYIKTNGSTVTRNAETCNGAGDADTFNDSEGVLMAEISSFVGLDDFRLLTLNSGNINNIILLGIRDSGNLYCAITDGGVNQFTHISDYSPINIPTKLLVKYKTNDISFWINGFKLATDTSATIPTDLNQLDFNYGNGAYPFYGNTKQIQYFDSALTDTELEQLTSWTSFSDMANGQQYSII